MEHVQEALQLEELLLEEYHQNLLLVFLENLQNLHLESFLLNH